MNEGREHMSWAPAASRAVLEARAELLSAIREFFMTRGVLEVETPILSRAGISDPNIGQFATAGKKWWLRSSPEHSMKRLLCAGSGDIFELGRVFRKGESGRWHNIEFTMLEWYRTGWTYHELMDEVVELLHFCLPGNSFRESRLTYRELIGARTGLDPFGADREQLERFIRSRNLELPELSRSELLDLVISHFVQPELPPDALTLVYDYPPEQAALARVREGDHPVAERFELYLGRFELANGYQELADPKEQERRFKVENRQRQAHGEAPAPPDRNLLDALRSGLPDCAGVALGVDRLLMYAVGADSLGEVLAFPDSIA